ncbi:MAG TPA: hypothetical protein VGW38_20230 [Chloroflexota bacterium]|nr:hypothetical protein [Chloroflexota bacterium]
MSLYRHRDSCLPATLVKAAEQEDVAHALDVVKQLKAINAASLTILNEARQSGKPALALQAIDRIHKQIELQAKLLGDLDERPQVNVLVSPEWQQVRSVILSTLAPFAEARTALAARLVAMEGMNGSR